MSDDRAAGKVIMRGARATAAGFIIRFGARIAFLYVAARLFGISLFGAYSLAVAAIELAVTIGGLGYKRLLFMRFEEGGGRPPPHILLDALLLVSLVGFGLGALLVLAVLALPEGLLSPNVAVALLFLAPMIAGQALLDTLSAATRWTRKIRYEVLSRSIVEPYAALIAALAAWRLGFGETGLLISYWASTLAALAYAAYGARRCLGPFRLRAWRPLPLRPQLRAGAEATLNDALSGLFLRVDLYLVGILLGEGPAGIYGMARQIRTPVRQVRQSFDGLLNPIIARTLAVKGPAETGAATAAAARLILALQLPLLIALIFAGLPLLAWFGPVFATGYWALLLLAAAEMVQGAFGVSDLIILYRRPAAQLAVTAVNIGVNLIAGALLIAPLGVTGAALSVLIGVLAGALIRRLALRAHFGVATAFYYSAGPLLAAALAIAAGWLLPGWPLQLAAALALYLLLLKLWLKATGETLRLDRFEAA